MSGGATDRFARSGQPGLAGVAGLAGLAGLAALAALAACGDNLQPRDDGGNNDGPVDGPSKPPRPELGEIFDRRGRPLIAELLISVDLPMGPARDAAHRQFSRAAEYAWRTYESEMASAIAVYDGPDSQATAGDGCGYAGGMPYSALAAIFADDRLYVDTGISVCGGGGYRDYFAVERAFIPPPQPHESCGGNALSYDVVDASYTTLIKGPTAPPQTPPITDGVGRHDDIDNRSFPFLGREHL